MSEIKLQIEGTGAVAATEDLIAFDGITAHYEIVGQTTKDGWIATLTNLITITVGTLELATRLHNWVKRYRQPEEPAQIDKVVLSGRDGSRILLINATIEQIKAILDR